MILFKYLNKNKTVYSNRGNKTKLFCYSHTNSAVDAIHTRLTITVTTSFDGNFYTNCVVSDAYNFFELNKQ